MMFHIIFFYCACLKYVVFITYVQHGWGSVAGGGGRKSMSFCTKKMRKR